MCTGPFLMSNSGNERHRHACSYAFGFVKKYSFVQKLEPKTFCDIFFITRFSKNNFRKNNFWKIKNFDFSKNHFWSKKIIEISMIFFSINFSRKIENFDFQNYFFENIFWNPVLKKNILHKTFSALLMAFVCWDNLHHIDK